MSGRGAPPAANAGGGGGGAGGAGAAENGPVQGPVRAAPGIFGSLAGLLRRMPPAAAAVKLPDVAAVAAGGGAAAPAPPAGVSWWTSTMRALVPVERAQMLYGYMTKKTDYNLVDFIGGLIQNDVKREHIIKLIEYNPSPSLASVDRQTAFNDEYTGKQLIAAIVDFAIVLAYYKKNYAAKVGKKVTRTYVELLFENLTIMLHAYTIHEEAKADTGIGLAHKMNIETRSNSQTLGAEQPIKYFGERALAIDIPAILNDALANIVEERNTNAVKAEKRGPKLNAILALLNYNGNIDGFSLSVDGSEESPSFSKAIVDNLRIITGGGGGGGGGGGAAAAAPPPIFGPLLGKDGLINTLKKLEQLPSVDGPGIAGIARIIDREVEHGIHVLRDTRNTSKNERMAAASLEAAYDEDENGNGNIAPLRNVEDVPLELGPQPRTAANWGLPEVLPLANVAAAQNAAARAAKNTAARAAKNTAARAVVNNSAAVNLVRGFAADAAARVGAPANAARALAGSKRKGPNVNNARAAVPKRPANSGGAMNASQRKTRKSARKQKKTRKMRKN